MLNWANRSWLSPRVGMLAYDRKPRSDSERTDQIMRLLATRLTPSIAGGLPAIETEHSSTYLPNHWAELTREPNDAIGANIAFNDDSAPIALRHQPTQVASVAAAVPAGLQVGQAGLAALRALGPLAAATLTAILKYFHDTLGRQPTPSELDAALAEHAGHNQPAAEVGEQDTAQQGIAAPHGGDDSDREEECGSMHGIDLATCRGYGRVMGKTVQKVCSDSARERYSECLRFGRAGVRTELWEPRQLR